MNLYYGNVTEEEIQETIKKFTLSNDKFKCICTQSNITHGYLIKHREFKYLLIVGVNCYKGIRGDKYDEINCFGCDILLINKKDKKLFHCKECIQNKLEIKKQKELDKINKINEKNKKINNYIINKEKEKFKKYFNILKEYLQNKLKIKKQKELNKIEKLQNSKINFGKYKNETIISIYFSDFQYIEKCVLNYQNKFYEKYNKNPKYDNIVKYYIYQQKNLLNLLNFNSS